MADVDQTRKTPLYDIHKVHKAKMIPFGGWLMPVSYAGTLAEHKQVREACGIFDVSHMGEVTIKGPDAERYLQYLTINDVTRIKDGEGQYNAILKPDGGMIDDLIIYRLGAEHYLICVNASNTDKDYQWFKSHEAGFKVTVANESARWSQIAVQGPQSRAAVEALLAASQKASFEALSYMNIMSVQLFGQNALLARTGYTGEHGYELYLPNEIAEKAWVALTETQARTGIQPIGLGARDTLRLEACYLLYGNDMDESVTPLEAGIGWATRLDGADFIGKDALLKQKASGVPRKNVAFVMTDGGIPRHDMDIYVGNEVVGKVSSGSVLPTVGGAGGLALVAAAFGQVGQDIELDVRGKRKLAKIVKKPLYTAKVKG